jgi:hypothetical protein
MHFHLSDTPSLISAIDWSKKFVNFLLRITHRQWSFRNSVVHFKIEGRTPTQHEEIIREFQELLQIDPKTLLPKYRHLYKDEDFEALGRSSPPPTNSTGSQQPNLRSLPLPSNENAADATDTIPKYNATLTSQPTAHLHPLLATPLPRSPANQDSNGRNAD